MTIEIYLRDVEEGDFGTLFEHQQDAVAARMAAFGTKDPDATTFAARWRASQAEASTTQKAIVLDAAVVGFVGTFLHDGKPQVTYWVARSQWGRGIATAALAKLLQLVTVRPIYASAAKDNAASIRVLTKCGFSIRGSEPAFATARSEMVEEVFLQLDERTPGDTVYRRNGA